MIDLELERAKRAGSNEHVSPASLLKMALEDIETGKNNPDGILIITIKRHENADWERVSYRAGLRKDAELVLLDLARESLIRRWLSSSG